MCQLAESAGESAAAARRLHGATLPSLVYADMLRTVFERIFGDARLTASALKYVSDLLERMAPSGPIEEMVAVQLVLSHARALRLNLLACLAEEPERIRILNEYADRAANTFRRLVIAQTERARTAEPGRSRTEPAAAAVVGVLIQPVTQISTSELGFDRPKGEVGIEMGLCR